MEDTTTLIANPFGGGIYFEVPDGSDLGLLDTVVDGAVRMPMFSTLDLLGHSQDAGVFLSEVEQWEVPWFELHSPNFSTSQPMNVAKLYEDPAEVLRIMNTAFTEIDRMAGRPDPVRAEWLAPDSWVTVRGTALTGSYPIFPDRELGRPMEDFDADRSYTSPLLYLDANFFTDEVALKDERDFNYVLWHEWGHVYNLPTLGYEEQESNVHLLASVFYNTVLGADIDTALRFSGFQRFDRHDAAIHTMLSLNWQDGKRLSYSEWDNELIYQTRSWARLVEIAALYGWDAVGAIHGAFYDRGAAEGKAYNYGIADDDFIETASTALNLNLGPVFDFWGVPPSPELASRLEHYPLPVEFEERLSHYRSIVPPSSTEFLPLYERLNIGEAEERAYFNAAYDEEMAAVIRARLDDIKCRYFGCP